MVTAGYHGTVAFIGDRPVGRIVNSLHARYPFLSSARSAVRETDVNVAVVVSSGGDRHPAVERGVERVRRALLDGTVRPSADGRRWGTTAEVLSYPVARMLVSLLDAPGAVPKYASAEATTAYERFVADFEGPEDDLKSTQSASLTLDALLADFDLGGEIERRQNGYAVAVGTYLSLASDLAGDGWRLPARRLGDGWVAVAEAELHELLRAAVEERVAADLPLSVPEELAAGLDAELGELESSFTDADFSHDIDTLAPDRFPPCVTALLERARGDDSLPPHSWFSLAAFLTGIGLDADEVLAFCEVEGALADRLRYRVERLSDEGSGQYAPPSCTTMQAYGDCVNKDARCETITHPMAYYEAALADGGDVTDWRER